MRGLSEVSSPPQKKVKTLFLKLILLPLNIGTTVDETVLASALPIALSKSERRVFDLSSTKINTYSSSSKPKDSPTISSVSTGFLLLLFKASTTAGISKR